MPRRTINRCADLQHRPRCCVGCGSRSRWRRCPRAIRLWLRLPCSADASASPRVGTPKVLPLARQRRCYAHMACGCVAVLQDAIKLYREVGRTAAAPLTCALLLQYDLQALDTARAQVAGRAVRGSRLSVQIMAAALQATLAGKALEVPLPTCVSASSATTRMQRLEPAKLRTAIAACPDGTKPHVSLFCCRWVTRRRPHVS